MKGLSTMLMYTTQQKMQHISIYFLSTSFDFPLIPSFPPLSHA